MWNKTIISFIAIVIILTSLRTYTWAICDQGELQGTWPVIVGAIDDLGQQCWEKCTLTIGADGVIEAGSIYEDCCLESSEIIGGQLSLSSNCVIEGTIETSNGSLYLDFGSIVGEELILRKYIE